MAAGGAAATWRNADEYVAALLAEPGVEEAGAWARARARGGGGVARRGWRDGAACEAERGGDAENRPWANKANRFTKTGCLGNDFVLHEPRVVLRFFWHTREQRLLGTAHFGHSAEGPPATAHGASVALVFDEILAYPVWRTGATAYTANLNINLRRRVPLNSTQRFEARVARREGRKWFLEGRILSLDGATVFADATGLWISSSESLPFSARHYIKAAL
jgi:acyl-coenzyme A thioesterase PaaI-like protein